MKKKNIIILSASLLSAMAVGAGIVGIAPKAAEVKAEGKEQVLFNITTSHDRNNSVAVFNVDKTIGYAGRTPDFEWFVDGVKKTANADVSSDGYFIVNLDKSSLADGDNGYHHFRLDAGTIICENDTTQYVLEKDYNFWRGRHPFALDDAAVWTYQHGAEGSASEMPSFSVSDSANGFTQETRWGLVVNYTKTSEWIGNSSALVNCGVYYYSTGDSTDYSLRYNTHVGGTTNSGEKYFELNDFDSASGLGASTSLTGSEYFLMNFKGFNTTTGKDQFISFYFPKGTLFGGGHGSVYACFLENDYYITVMKDKIFGTTKSTAELIYTPVQSFVDTNMKMDDATYDGTGTGLCKGEVYNAAKTAYNALSDNQKFAFCNYDGYADAKARLLAWAAANGDALDASNTITVKQSSSLLIGASSRGSDVYVAAICAGALALVVGGACFVFRKKRED